MRVLVKEVVRDDRSMVLGTFNFEVLPREEEVIIVPIEGKMLTFFVDAVVHHAEECTGVAETILFVHPDQSQA